ncbi:MAG: pantoate--beta-alanine ligase [Bacillota bacterium]
MRCISKIDETRQVIRQWKAQDLSIGLVPTMGYLHEGHMSLIEKSAEENDRTVVSIFVNPIQFGPNEDYNSYPRDMERDLVICGGLGAGLVFAPTPEDMYIPPHLVHVDVDELGDVLCGAQRPGHFRGVCTVVAKLFNIIQPDRAYFGQKDAQQLAIIKKMVQDLNFGLEIVPCPIVREKDGLAMSSRNAYLSAEERQAALVISKSLFCAKQAMQDGERDAAAIKRMITDGIKAEPLAQIGYVEVVDAVTLQPVEKIEQAVLTAVAVKIGRTRLIDNFTFPEDGQ